MKNQKITFTSFPANTNYTEGKTDTCKFYAKLFDEPSEYGIKEGRVSKLTIKMNDGTVIVNFDRGWDIRPKTAESKKIFKEVLTFLENAPKRFED